ncbi:acyltransferase family protein [Actomonas aquatica]|uniref:Acyltransferase family protein n=1 Tax=Actomonas aquatica TaxID=2866162 RepID=A0ABZ1C7W5_9BACT|nr:acyltransferase family protein [Opitutus sp. WL0086]WRQ87512.1 acyltransferase family protein [Opitutus sp. WL0086]
MNPSASPARLDYLDAVRAYALLLGVVFHAALSFLPIYIGWAVMDVSTSAVIGPFMLLSHSFRMALFFLIAGYFSHLSFHRQGGAGFLANRWLRIVVPFVVGWFILKPLLVSGWIMGGQSMRGEWSFWGGIRDGYATLSTLPEGLLMGSHLWFLYYLILCTALLLCVRAALRLTGPVYRGLLRAADATLGRIARAPWSIYLLVLPTAGALWFMQGWGMDTPDRSLDPHLPALLIYGGFFTFGWMLRRNTHLLDQVVALSALRWVLVVVSGLAALWLSEIQGDTGHPHFQLARSGFVLSYAVVMWSLVLLTLGVFQKLIRRPSATVRYVADSSYWMYLIHLPIVLWLQVVVAEWSWHWSLKLSAISLATIGIALLTYELFVRSTFIGRILNGRRKDRALFRRSATAAAPSVVAEATRT